MDSVAEKALLLSMGWQESTGSESENELSHQEIEEFFNMVRVSKAAVRHGSTLSRNSTGSSSPSSSNVST